ncbi:CDP-alcohol phosphatidyltransferase family protein [Roseivirga echinicomitans]
MSKLPKANRFIDISDYGRPAAKAIAYALKETAITPIHITFAFMVSGLMAIWCIINGFVWAAACFLILKSILDAADGELARVKETPSYTGRYLDSVADIVLNALILFTLWQLTNDSAFQTILAFLGMQLQGTVYNYYYVILRNRFHGDTTSRVFETHTPVALEGEKQRNVNLLFFLYKAFYGLFDKAIYLLDRSAVKSTWFPNWFMTIISLLGLGSQLLIISIFLVLGLKELIIPFFIGYTAMIFLVIGIRKAFSRETI